MTQYDPSAGAAPFTAAPLKVLILSFHKEQRKHRQLRTDISVFGKWNLKTGGFKAREELALYELYLTSYAEQMLKWGFLI